MAHTHKQFVTLPLVVVLAALAGCATQRQWYGENDPEARPFNISTGRMQRSQGQVQQTNGGFEGTIRGQNEGPGGYARGPVPVSGGPDFSSTPRTAYQPPSSGAFDPPHQPVPSPGGNQLPFGPPGVPPETVIQPPPGNVLGMPQNFADVDAIVEEARTGRFMFGVGVNSDAGVTGQIVIDERNFDLFAVPRSWADVVNGRAFRGRGQGFRLEAMPGSQFQRYLVSLTEPYFLDTPVSLSLSGFYYDRNFFDWDEQRGGGRVSLGYRLTHDLSVALAMRAEKVKIFNPRVAGVPELDAVLGSTDLFMGELTLTHDTRDIPFAPTEGHLIELSYAQGFGEFDFPRGEATYSKYHMVRERADGSGRHVFSWSLRAGITGSQTPLFEHFFAGGFSTIRGYDFRGASPVKKGVIVGGDFRLLGSVEYLFPLTADDMLKGVVFVDYGTVEENVEITGDNFRVAPGFGLRINIPALGPAPLAFDFAFPVASAATDREEVFSFFLGLGRF